MSASNIQIVDTTGAGKGRDKSYQNNIAMNFQNGGLNAGIDKQAKEWGDRMWKSLQLNLPSMVPANGIFVSERHHDEAMA